MRVLKSILPNSLPFISSPYCVTWKRSFTVKAPPSSRKPITIHTSYVIRHGCMCNAYTHIYVHISYHVTCIRSPPLSLSLCHGLPRFLEKEKKEKNSLSLLPSLPGSKKALKWWWRWWRRRKKNPFCHSKPCSISSLAFPFFLSGGSRFQPHHHQTWWGLLPFLQNIIMHKVCPEKKCDSISFIAHDLSVQWTRVRGPAP